MRPLQTKWFISLLLLISSLIFTLPVAAQRQLESLSRDFDERWRLERAEAESIATAEKMPIRSVAPDGTIREIKRFSRGIPVYYKTHNVTAAKTISTDKVYPGGVAGLSLTGSGVTLGEWDGGGIRTTHQEFGGRILNTQGTASLHSTHVAGTMISAGLSPASRGMSYAAQLRAYDWNADLAEMAAQAAAGLRVSNHSYGFITGWDYDYFGDGRWAWFGTLSLSTVEDYRFGYYDQEAQDWDLVAYNAPYYLIVKSAGNDRNEGPVGSSTHWVRNPGWTLVTATRNRDGNSGYDCVEGAGVAKNPLVVGAIEDIPGGYSTPAGVVMSTFSSWGPTDDGRIKPDVVANGVGLYSTITSADNAYGSISGTSMATPSVTGSIGLLLQHQQNLHPGDSLLASTLKGIVIHTADEAGSNPGPDYAFGWGLMNTRKAADLMTLDSADGPLSHIREFPMATGDTVVIDFASTGDEPLRVTLSWNDIPVGLPPVALDPPNPILRNDMDMRVTRKSDGAVFSPWILNPASPGAAATTGDNARDNVEQIHIDNPGRTLYTLTITHKTTIVNSPEMVSLIMSGNVESLGAALGTLPDSAGYAEVPGAIFADSLRVYNTGDSTLAASIEKDPGSFWLSLTEDSVNIPSLDSAVVHYSVNGSLWSQWTEYSGSLTFTSNDPNSNPLVVPVVVNVLGPSISAAPGSFITDLDSAEIGYDTLRIRNTGFITLNAIVADSAGALPSWITADPDTLAIPAGDSAEVILTTNALDEPLGDYQTTVKIASNDSATGAVLIPFFLNIGTRTLVAVDVTDSWNLVSLPVEPITGVKTVLFPTALTAAFGYDDGYFQADTLRTGPAYWMKFATAQSFDVDGYTYDADTIPLTSGWNLVGSIFEPVAAAAAATNPSGILTSEFYLYDDGYAFTDSIRPGKGYWVQSGQAGSLYLSVLPAAAPKTQARFAPGKYNSITVSGGSGASQTLWFAAGIDAPAKTALPPKPPKGGFDVRFADDSFFASFTAEADRPQTRTITISGAGREVRVSARIGGTAGAEYLIRDASGAVTRLADGADLTFPAGEGGETSLVLMSGRENLPEEFALGQNYPNPFNPATTISFSLPVEEFVSIRLYNVLGNEVSTIASRRFEAGRHTIEFDADQLPSGVYIYTMRAGTFSASRKMVLMR